MDAKALAKSKRAHSLHNSKKHQPNPTSKATIGSVTATGGKKATSKREKDKSKWSQSSKDLPSNLDRYGEEFDSGSEEPPQVTTHNQASDAVAPKSKGADYAYLLNEAKAQSQANSSADSSSLFDDVFKGFHQGSGPLLSVEGQRLLSWFSDDNFPFGDVVSGYGRQEASYFSLNLDALAEQLSKASLVERLFIEPDVLPPELFSELQTSNENDPAHFLPTVCTGATETTLDGQASTSIPEQNRSTFQSPECSSPLSSTSSCNISAPALTTQPLDDFRGTGGTSEKPEVRIESSTERSSRFEGTAAEAELDMLLDSFSETKFFDSFAVAKNSSYTSSEIQASSIHWVPVHRPGVLPDATSVRSVSTSLDDSLDDLLEEASNQTNSTSGKGIPPVHEVKIVSNDKPSAYQSNSKSKILDDFDSWFDTV